MEKEYKKPFIVSLQHYDTKVEIRKEYSDVKLEDLMEMLRALVLAVGYHPDNIKEYFD